MELTLTLSSFMLCTYVEGILASNTIALSHILKKEKYIDQILSYFASTYATLFCYYPRYVTKGKGNSPPI
jgi:hypothetical protein